MVRSLLLSLAIVGISATAQTKPSTKLKSSSGKNIAKIKTFESKAPRRLKFVPTVGLATFTLTGLGPLTVDRGLYLGALINQDLGPIVLEAGLGYVQAGARGPVTDANGIQTDVRTTVRMNYLLIHAAAKRYFYKRQLYVKGGLSPAINIRSEATAKLGGKSHTFKLQNVRDMDLIASAATGFEVPAGDRGITMGAELSLHRGLLDVNTGNGDDMYNQGLMISGFVSL